LPRSGDRTDAYFNQTSTPVHIASSSTSLQITLPPGAIIPVYDSTVHLSLADLARKIDQTNSKLDAIFGRLADGSTKVSATITSPIPLPVSLNNNTIARLQPLRVQAVLPSPNWRYIPFWDNWNNFFTSNRIGSNELVSTALVRLGYINSQGKAIVKFYMTASASHAGATVTTSSFVVTEPVPINYNASTDLTTLTLVVNVGDDVRNVLKPSDATQVYASYQKNAVDLYATRNFAELILVFVRA